MARMPPHRRLLLLSVVLLFSASSTTRDPLDLVWESITGGRGGPSRPIARATVAPVLRDVARLFPSRCAPALGAYLDRELRRADFVRDEFEDVLAGLQDRAEGARRCVEDEVLRAGQITRQAGRSSAPAAAGRGGTWRGGRTCEVCVDLGVDYTVGGGAAPVRMLDMEGVCVDVQSPFDRFTVRRGKEAFRGRRTRVCGRAGCGRPGGGMCMRFMRFAHVRDECGRLAFMF